LIFFECAIFWGLLALHFLELTIFKKLTFLK